MGLSWPRVSVIVPVLNEERTVGDCLRAVLEQDYPPDQLEVIVVDGMSSDHTRDIVQTLGAANARVRLLLSPRRRTPFSMNIGVAAATGDVLVRIDGHSTVKPDHVRRCVDFLLHSGADHVGGILSATGRTYVGKTVALAMSSPFGVGTARFRYTNREQDVDTVPFGAYRRETLLRLGGFVEHFLIGQDSELDHRINLGGGRVRVTPSIRTAYFCRESLWRLAIQYFRYGRARAHVLRKHGSLPSLRTVMPAAALILVGSLAVAAIFSALAQAALVAVVALYSATCVAAGMAIAARHEWRYAALLPAALATLHISHGTGFLSALPGFLSAWPTHRALGSLARPNEVTLDQAPLTESGAA